MPALPDTSKYWFAFYVKPRQEFKAELQCRAAGTECYLPTVTVVRQWSDRKKKITEPLLRGYIFIFAEERQRLATLELPAMVRCVSEHGRPAKIPEHEIDNLRRFVQQQRSYSVLNGIKAGARVLIKEGPLKGVEGVVIDEFNKKALGVSVNLLQRTIITYITDADILEVLQQLQEQPA